MNRKVAESAYLSGTTRWDTFLLKFEQDWEQPLRDAMIGTILATMPPGVKEELRAIAPEQMKRLEETHGG
jgi:hypothetical protein